LFISYGNGCNNLGEPFINNCNFDASGAMLRHIYPQTALKPRAAFSTSNVRMIHHLSRTSPTLTPLLPAIQSQLLAFSQANYTGGSPSSVSMGDTGFIYVPTSCQKGACTLPPPLFGWHSGSDEFIPKYSV
jgi:hypothetical protein